ncbi:GntR family transcriptional regulator [Streptomyces luteireticuli]|uniref:GntR family transcriptional regulator n=1 Tax=Streptomyces luteireticuli TaxID=173858 RepID=UPI0035586C57
MSGDPTSQETGENTGYAEIAAYYRQKIQDGTLTPGDAMPSLRQVCEHFGVAQTTANRAYRTLKAEGLTLPKSGVGTVVAEPTSNNVTTQVHEQGTDENFAALRDELKAMREEQQKANAQIIKLLSGLVDKDPSTD